MSTRDRVAAAILALAAVLVVAHGAQFGFCLQDDTFISLRYARNLVSGNGLVFNPGERVEGYTNPLWTVLCALPFVLGLDPPAFTRWAGLFAAAGGVLAAGALAGMLAPPRERWPSAAAAGVLVAAWPAFAIEGAMGLETTLFAALAAAGIALFLREVRTEDARPWSGAVLALAALTRPEGVLVAGLVFLADVAGGGWTPARRGRTAWRWTLCAVPVAAHLLFRFAYYGDLVPNTFHAKVGGGGSAILARGALYAGTWALAAAPLLVLALAGVRLALSRARRAPAAWLVVAVPLVYVLYVIKVGGDYKPTFRFFALPFVCLAALAGIAWTRRAAWVVAVLAVAAGLIGLGGEGRAFAKQRAWEVPAHLAAGRWLAANVPAGTWIATANAGAIPYASGLPTIDMLGLCDAHIARRAVQGMGTGVAGHEKGDGAYVLERRPRIILFQLTRFTERPLDARAALQPVWLGERELIADPRFAASYGLRSTQLPGFYFNYFERSEP